MDHDINIRRVLQLYDLPESSVISLLNGGTINRNYVINSGGTFFVLRMRHKRYSSKDSIDYEEQYLLFLHDHGFPVAPPLKNKDGEFYTLLKDSIYQLFPFLQGRPFDPDIREEVSEAGWFLGKMHQTLEAFTPEKERKLSRLDDPAMDLPIVDSYMVDTPSSKTTELKKLQYVREKIMKVAKHVPDCVYHNLPSTVIHGDYHPGNVVYHDGRISGLFDFDWVSRQPRIRDVADGIIYFSGVRDAPIDGSDIYSLTQSCRFDLARLRIFINAYLENTSFPFQAEEVDSMPYFVGARLIHSRVQALDKIPENRSLEMLTEGLKQPLQWLQEHEKEVMSVLNGGEKMI